MSIIFDMEFIMPFREKSAWIMSFALVLGTFFYFGAVLSIWREIGQIASPAVPLVVIFTVILIAIAIIGHIIIATFAPKDANAPMDEREREIFSRAGNLSSYVLGFGVITSLGHYLLLGSGDLLFYTVFASLIVAQIAEYLLQILIYRTSF